MCPYPRLILKNASGSRKVPLRLRPLSRTFITLATSVKPLSAATTVLDEKVEYTLSKLDEIRYVDLNQIAFRKAFNLMRRSVHDFATQKFPTLNNPVPLLCERTGDRLVRDGQFGQALESYDRALSICDHIPEHLAKPSVMFLFLLRNACSSRSEQQLCCSLFLGASS